MWTAASLPDVLTRPPGIAAAEVVAILGTGALGVAALLPAGGIEDGPVVCPFRLATGLPCPGCGLTRSWVYLTHGDLSRSVTNHPFGILLAVSVLTLLGYVVARRLRGAPAPSLERIVRHPVTIVVLAAWLAFGFGRLALALF